MQQPLGGREASIPSRSRVSYSNGWGGGRPATRPNREWEKRCPDSIPSPTFLAGSRTRTKKAHSHQQRHQQQQQTSRSSIVCVPSNGHGLGPRLYGREWHCCGRSVRNWRARKRFADEVWCCCCCGWIPCSERWKGMRAGVVYRTLWRRCLAVVIAGTARVAARGRPGDIVVATASTCFRCPARWGVRLHRHSVAAAAVVAAAAAVAVRVVLQGPWHCRSCSVLLGSNA